MARKKNRWRGVDDPEVIFGKESATDAGGDPSDPAYEAFRRHIEGHIQGETKAFHDLRSTAEHEMQAASVVASSPKNAPQTKQKLPQARELPLAPHPSAANPLPNSKGLGLGLVLMLSCIFAAIGILLHSLWQQTQPLNHLAKLSNGSSFFNSRNRTLSEPNCEGEKSSSKKTSPATAKLPNIPTGQKSVKAAAVTADPPIAELPSPRPQALEAAAPVETSSKGLTMRAIEIRKGPGKGFEIIDSLPPGFALEGTLTTDRQWLRIKPGAFVSIEAIELRDRTAPQGFQTFWVGPRVANIREFPLLSARILRKVEAGVELQLQSFNTEWGLLSGGGYVFKKLLTEQKPQNLQLPAQMRVVVDKAEIHSGPGKQFPALGVYFKNHKVQVQEIQDGWLRIGQDQFIRAQEMELSTNPKAGKTL